MPFEALDPAPGFDGRISEPLGTTPFWENSETQTSSSKSNTAFDVKDFGNLLVPRQGHGRRGEIVDRRYQVDRLGGMLPTGRIERFPLA